LKFLIPPPYKTNKFKKDIIQYVLITILVYSIVYLISGLLVSFGNNPYSTSIRGIIINLFATASIIISREYIRYKLINNVYNKDRKLIFIMLVIVFSLIDFNIASLFNSANVYYLFKSIFYNLIPSIIKNVLFTYLAIYVDCIPAIIYEMVFYLILWISPVLPNSPWVLEAILNSVFPFILLLYCRYYIQKKDRFHLNAVSKPVNPSGIIPFGIILVFVIWFALGIFPIKPVGIATASMVPELNVGDLTIIQKCTANDVKVQDIIEYQMDGYTVIHRIITITQEDGEFFFITKGDNNTSEDKTPVSEQQLIGKVIFKIPYLALPTIWIHNLNAKTQVDVETGI
jgi:signal peptidase